MKTRGLVLLLLLYQVGTQIQFLSPVPLQPISTKDLAMNNQENSSEVHKWTWSQKLGALKCKEIKRRIDCYATYISKEHVKIRHRIQIGKNPPVDKK